MSYAKLIHETVMRQSGSQEFTGSGEQEVKSPIRSVSPGGRGGQLTVAGRRSQVLVAAE